MHFEVLIDKQENPRKCTLTPLIERPDFRVRYFQRNRTIAYLSADFLLHIDGKPLPELLGESKTANSIAVIDCIWRHVEGICNKIEKPWPTLARIPEGFQTAYPRKNKAGQDPEGGLATNEALFIAAAFCGHWDTSLLSDYYFAEEFLKINEAAWGRYGLTTYVETK